MLFHMLFSISPVILFYYVSHSKTKQINKVYFRRFSNLLKSKRTQTLHNDHPDDQCPWKTTDMFLAVFLIDHTPLHWYELIWIKKRINIKYIIIFLNFSYLVRHVVWCSYNIQFLCNHEVILPSFNNEILRDY